MLGDSTVVVAPDWASDRSELWNRALVRDYAQAQFVDRGMVADIALHAPGRDGDERNHHAHILLTTREVDPDGFTTKNRDWNKVEVLEGWRQAWALDSNTALERAGFDERVDHRTLAEQRDEALERAEWARMGGDEAAPGESWGRGGRSSDMARTVSCHQSREQPQDDDAPEREAPQDFAARMRQAAAGIDRDAFADRAAALRDAREADERHTAQEIAREQQLVQELEREQERAIQRSRGLGMWM